jgi:hypothetical protein
VAPRGCSPRASASRFPFAISFPVLLTPHPGGWVIRTSATVGGEILLLTILWSIPHGRCTIRQWARGASRRSFGARSLVAGWGVFLPLWSGSISHASRLSSGLASGLWRSADWRDCGGCLVTKTDAGRVLMRRQLWVVCPGRTRPLVDAGRQQFRTAKSRRGWVYPAAQIGCLIQQRKLAAAVYRGDVSVIRDRVLSGTASEARRAG